MQLLFGYVTVDFQGLNRDEKMLTASGMMIWSKKYLNLTPAVNSTDCLHISKGIHLILPRSEILSLIREGGQPVQDLV